MHGIFLNGEISLDADVNRAEIDSAFQSRWDVQNEVELDLLCKQLAVTEGHELPLTTGLITTALANLRRKYRLDYNGGCTMALIIINHAFPAHLRSILGRLMSSTEQMRSLSLQGKVFGKHSSFPHPTETRAILPLDSLLSLVDALINHFISMHVDQWCPIDSRIYLGARPRTQPLELAQACQLTVEKSLDRHSKGALEHADILKF